MAMVVGASPMAGAAATSSIATHVLPGLMAAPDWLMLQATSPTVVMVVVAVVVRAAAGRRAYSGEVANSRAGVAVRGSGCNCRPAESAPWHGEAGSERAASAIQSRERPWQAHAHAKQWIGWPTATAGIGTRAHGGASRHAGSQMRG
jgi:hypothetical protein